MLPVWHESLLEGALERSRQAALFPLWPLPHRQHSKEGCPAWVIGKAPPLTTYQVLQDKEIWPQWEYSKTSELSDEEIVNLSDGEFKALVIKMLTELIELGQKWKNKRKVPKMK